MPIREEMNSLAKEMIHSYEARVERVEEIRKATQAQLRELGTSHNTMATQLKANLSRTRAALRQDGVQRKSSVRTQLKQLAVSVASDLRELDAVHNTMAAQLKANLSRTRVALRQDEVQRKSSVRTQLKGLSDVRSGAQAAWQDLVATMESKRSKAIAVAEALSPSLVQEVVPTAPVVPKPSRAKPLEEASKEEEEIVARAVVGEVTQEFINLTNRVFEYLANHPDGTRLTQLEEEFKLNRFQAARVVRHLIDEGKTEKLGLLYLAV